MDCSCAAEELIRKYCGRVRRWAQSSDSQQRDVPLRIRHPKTRIRGCDVQNRDNQSRLDTLYTLHELALLCAHEPVDARLLEGKRWQTSHDIPLHQTNLCRPTHEKKTVPLWPWLPPTSPRVTTLAELISQSILTLPKSKGLGQSCPNTGSKGINIGFGCIPGGHPAHLRP